MNPQIETLLAELYLLRERKEFITEEVYISKLMKLRIAISKASTPIPLTEKETNYYNNSIAVLF